MKVHAFSTETFLIIIALPFIDIGFNAWIGCSCVWKCCSSHFHASTVIIFSVFQSKSHMHLPVVMQLNNQALMLSSHWDECFSKFNISAAGSNIGECSFISKTSCSYITIILRILALKNAFQSVRSPQVSLFRNRNPLWVH